MDRGKTFLFFFDSRHASARSNYPYDLYEGHGRTRTASKKQMRRQPCLILLRTPL